MNMKKWFDGTSDLLKHGKIHEFTNIWSEQAAKCPTVLAVSQKFYLSAVGDEQVDYVHHSLSELLLKTAAAGNINAAETVCWKIKESTEFKMSCRVGR